MYCISAINNLLKKGDLGCMHWKMTSSRLSSPLVVTEIEVYK